MALLKAVDVALQLDNRLQIEAITGTDHNRASEALIDTARGPTMVRLDEIPLDGGSDCSVSGGYDLRRPFPSTLVRPSVPKPGELIRPG